MKAQSIRRENLTSGGRMKRTIRKARHHNNTVTTNLALFGKNQIMSQRIAILDVRDAKLLTTLKRIVHFKTRKKQRCHKFFKRRT